MSIKLVSTGGGSVTLDVPSTASDYTLTAPARTATVLADDGSGKIRKADLPSGSVIQVVTTFKNDVFSASLSGGSFTDITGFSVTITPTSSSNKILVLANYGLSASSPAVASRLLRNGTLISNGSVSGARVSASSPSVTNAGDTNRGVPTSIHYLDSPSTTSAVTYKLQIGAIEPSGTHTCWFNTSGGDTDAGYIARMGSSITVMEIAA
jgi:hypothetical protein